MTEFRVTWVLDVEAETPEGAAAKALAVMRRPDGTATVMQVQPRSDFGTPVTIDADPWLEVPDPDGYPHEMPIYSGLASKAWQSLIQGEYAAVDQDTREPYTLAVQWRQSHATKQ